MFSHNCFILNQKNHYTNTEFRHMSSGAGQTSKPKEEPDGMRKEEKERDSAQVELKQKLLEAFVTYPPRKLAGIQRNFVLFGLVEYLKRSIHRHFSSEEVIELVGWFYNIEMLTDDEEINMLDHEEDFSLPQSYFPKVHS